MSQGIEINIPLCRKWLLLGILALATSGLLSMSVVLLRLHSIKNLFMSVNNIFDISLVMHVNLSVLVWTCSIISIIFTFMIGQNSKRYANSIWWLAVLGTLLMLVSIFVPDTVAIKSNYIPVLINQLFLSGLTIFLFSILLNAWLAARSPYVDETSVGVYGLATIIFSAYLAFSLAYKTLPANLSKIDTTLFYEYLFWGGGHILQFAFSQTLLLVYVIILDIKSDIAKKWIMIAVLLNSLIALLAPLAYLICTADDPALINFFTWHMRIGGAVIPIAILAVIMYNFKAILRPENRALLLAAIIFIYGGILGLMSVHGNVTIPAHYHGSIVGMTISFMGFAYWLLPSLKLGKLPTWLMNTQLYIYSIGQLAHITGLGWLGGYGAMRKVAELPDINVIMPRVLFAVGGMMAVIGGFMFAIIMIMHMKKNWKPSTA